MFLAGTTTQQRLNRSDNRKTDRPIADRAERRRGVAFPHRSQLRSHRDTSISTSIGRLRRQTANFYVQIGPPKTPLRSKRPAGLDRSRPSRCHNFLPTPTKCRRFTDTQNTPQMGKWRPSVAHARNVSPVNFCYSSPGGVDLHLRNVISVSFVALY